MLNDQRDVDSRGRVRLTAMTRDVSPRMSSKSTISNRRLPEDLHRRVRVFGVHVSRYRRHRIVIIVANAVEHVAASASQPGRRFRPRFRFPRRLCGQER